jgi:hypothetical protein
MVQRTLAQLENACVEIRWHFATTRPLLLLQQIGSHPYHGICGWLFDERTVSFTMLATRSIEGVCYIIFRSGLGERDWHASTVSAARPRGC